MNDDESLRQTSTPEAMANAVEDPLTKDVEAISNISAVESILEVVCQTTGTRFAAVARVTEARWISCAVKDEIDFGLLPGDELPIKTTFCDEIRSSGQAIIIDHADGDEAFCQHPTPKMYGFQSYISVPIVVEGGDFFGTLCALDPKPTQLSAPETVSMFELFADLIAFHLNAQKQIKVSETALFDEQQTAQLREQFFAILSHDLRNPLNAISSGSELLLKMPLSDRANTLTTLIKRSAARMTVMIENTMDFARARLGGGLSLVQRMEPNLGATLEQVIAEADAVWADRKIKHDIELKQPVFCDADRIAQMFSNLLANALTHSDDNSPVWVSAHSHEGGFELSVANQCEPIDPQVLARLFEPYERASARPGQQGLGLGLYIASQIAKAHGGTLEVTSSAVKTQFSFRMLPTSPVPEQSLRLG